MTEAHRLKSVDISKYVQGTYVLPSGSITVGCFCDTRKRFENFYNTQLTLGKESLVTMFALADILRSTNSAVPEFTGMNCFASLVDLIDRTPAGVMLVVDAGTWEEENR